MRFPGLLQVPETSGHGVRVVLQLEDDLLTLGYRDGVLGTWPLEEITVQRRDDTRFILDLGEERIDFITYDPLLLVSELLPAIEEAQARFRRGGIWPFGRREKGSADPAEETPVDPPEETPAAPGGDPWDTPEVLDEPDRPPEVLEVVVEDDLMVTTTEAEPQEALGNDSSAGLVGRLRQAGTPLLERMGVTRPTVPEHDHAFASQRLPGDLMRHVCTICSHVSIGAPQ